MLQNVEILLSDTISTVISIPYGGELVSADPAPAFSHILEENGLLKIYLPKSKRRRELSLSAKLPMALLKYLGATEYGSQYQLGIIFGVSSLKIVDLHLIHFGIIEVDGVARPEGEDDDNDNDDNEDEVVRANGATDSLFDETSTTIEGSERDYASSYGLSRRYRGFQHVSTVEDMSQSQLFKELLNAVIEQTADIGDLPGSGQVLGTSATRTTISDSLGTLLSFSAPGNGEKLIGVAGELFVSSFGFLSVFRNANDYQVYELLSSLSLPDFGIQNWRSSLRTLVSVNENYHSISSWSARETSDIVYQDRNSTLTNLFIRNGYLEENWRGRRPEYYIEVKSTISLSEETSFYCSQRQLDMMEEKKLIPNEATDEIYVIARVFALGLRSQIKLYVDPSAHRRDGTLEFRADNYTVTPKI
jgi:hypothetical protein